MACGDNINFHPQTALEVEVGVEAQAGHPAAGAKLDPTTQVRVVKQAAAAKQDLAALMRV